MARGWESKAVENQMAEAEMARDAKPGRQLTPDERSWHMKKMALTSARARVVQDLATAHDSRYRALLERSLAFIDQELASLAHGRSSTVPKP
jgi:hypothetical protein